MTEPREISDVEIEAGSKRITEAHEWVADLCTGKRRWRMRVPVDQGDTDIVLSEALTFAEQLVCEVRRLRASVGSAS